MLGTGDVARVVLDVVHYVEGDEHFERVFLRGVFGPGETIPPPIPGSVRNVAQAFVGLAHETPVLLIPTTNHETVWALSEPEELSDNEVAALWADNGPILGVNRTTRWVELRVEEAGVTVDDIPAPPALTIIDVMEVGGSCLVVVATPSGILIGLDPAARRD